MTLHKGITNVFHKPSFKMYLIKKPVNTKVDVVNSYHQIKKEKKKSISL